MIGKILGNRYEILEKIGGGGMAIVYKAKCNLLNRIVAVKILRNELTEDEEFVSRFYIESQAAASLTHPNIVSIYDVGKQGNIHYIVMEYVDGITLKDFIRNKGVLSYKEALQFAIQICSGLEVAHKKNIIHRDIKPQNIIITKDGIAKITDFGIARAVTSSTLTMSGNTVGSVHYFSPEQARGGYTDAKSDIYSLGIVMYEMLTGKVPFDGDSPVSIAIKHIQEEPIPPRKLNNDIPACIQSIILKAISKKKSNRYNSVKQMKEDLFSALKDPDADLIDKENYDYLSTKRVPIVNMTGSEIMRENKDDIRKKPNRKSKKYKKKDSTAVVAAIITSIIIISILSFIGYKLVKGFLSPEDDKEQAVPTLIGQDIEMMKKYYESYGFNIVVEQETYDKEMEKGKIIFQDPEASIKVKLPTTIKVNVSLGPEMVEVPDLSNKEYREAKLMLDKKDLLYKEVYEFSETIPQGVVIRQDPESETEVQAKEIVYIYISNGPDVKMITMPNLEDLSEQKAKEMIEKNGLVVGEIMREESDKAKGTVIRQSVVARSQIEENSSVDLVVSKGKPEVEFEKNLTIYLPRDYKKDGNVEVKITVINGTDEKTVYQKQHSVDKFPFDVKLKGKGNVLIGIYFDNELKIKYPLNFGG